MSPPVQFRCRSPLPSWGAGLGRAWPAGSRWAPSRHPTLLGALLLAASLWPHVARSEAPKEYDLKAVLLFHLTQFVEWPPSSFPDENAPLVIGVLGHDPFGPALEQVVRLEHHGNRGIVVKHFARIDAVRDCHILFIDEWASRDVPRILAALRGQPVLTVGDSPGFAARGGMVELVKNRSEKIFIQINRTAAEAAGLTISARLLRVATVVGAADK